MKMYREKVKTSHIRKGSMNSTIVVKTKNVMSGNLVLNIVKVLLHWPENNCIITSVYMFKISSVKVHTSLFTTLRHMGKWIYCYMKS